MTYKEVIEELIYSGVASAKGVYFNYENEPDAELYNSFWNASQNFLESDDLVQFFKFPRVYYGFTDKDDKNAAAYLEGKYSLIVVLSGLIHNISSVLYESAEEAFKGDELKVYEKVAPQFGISIKRYFIEIATSFVMYHETAHLIQRNPDKMSYFEFLVDKCIDKAKVEERHVKEFDADWFASNRLAMQIMGLVTQVYGEGNSEEKVEFLHKMADLALTAVFILMVDFATDEPELYFDEKCHPHPSVRLTYTVNYFVSSIKFLAGIELNERRIIHNALEISMELNRAKDPNPVEVWSKRIFTNSEEINTYIKKIIADVAKYPECCYNRLPNNK